MKILLIGYGKMGQAIEKKALERGHHIAGIIDISNQEELGSYHGTTVDLAIEFTQPGVALSNISICLQNGIPVISGTTGWLEKYDEVVRLCEKHQGTFLYASNFSLGVNLFFKLNKWLARLMDRHVDYSVAMKEIHHIHKKDAPSGTAITLAEGIVENHHKVSDWSLDKTGSSIIPIKALREGEVPGTHIVSYRSGVDNLEVKHEAFSRDGFVLGAVLVAEWIQGKEGVFTMDDFLEN